jgi:hypothetical protein
VPDSDEGNEEKWFPGRNERSCNQEVGSPGRLSRKQIERIEEKWVRPSKSESRHS